MNRQSTKKALLIPFILMVLTSIALVVVWFIFKPLVAIAAAILVVMIIISIVLVRQALLKMDNYVDNLSGHISAGSNRAIKRLPIGMVVLDADDHIEWINQYMSEHLETNVISEPVNEVFPNILKQLERYKKLKSNMVNIITTFVIQKKKVVYISSILQMKCKLMSYMKNQSQSSQRYS